MIFNEKVLYKDISSIETDMADSNTSLQKFKFITLEGLLDVTIQNKNQRSSKEYSNIFVPTTTQDNTELCEPIIYVSKSSRVINPLTIVHIFFELYFAFR
jgi:hypothetical protein